MVKRVLWFLFASTALCAEAVAPTVTSTATATPGATAHPAATAFVEEIKLLEDILKLNRTAAGRGCADGKGTGTGVPTGTGTAAACHHGENSTSGALFPVNGNKTNATVHPLSPAYVMAKPSPTVHPLNSDYVMPRPSSTATSKTQPHRVRRSLVPPSPLAVSPSAVSPPALSPPAISPPAVSPPVLSPTSVSPSAVSPSAVSPSAASPSAGISSAVGPTPVSTETFTTLPIGATPFPSPTPDLFVIYLNSTASKNDRDKIKNDLITQNGIHNIYNISDQKGEPLVWVAVLNETQQAAINASKPAVAFLYKDVIVPLNDFQDTPNHNTSQSTNVSSNYVDTTEMKKPETKKPRKKVSKRDSSQENAGWALGTISQPKPQGKQPVPPIPDTYDYDSLAGNNVTVYMIDSGATPEAPEYAQMPGSKRWLYPKLLDGELDIYYDRLETEDTENDPLNHGTCVLSKIAGPQFGVAKLVDVVIVKLQLLKRKAVIPNNPTDYGPFVRQSSVLKAFQDVLNDIQQKKLQGRAVISFSGTFFTDDQQGYDAFANQLLNITAQGIPIVASAGSSTFNQTINELPAAFAPYIPGLIVVGASDQDGKLADFSQTSQSVMINAPGDGIQCAGNDASTKYVRGGEGQPPVRGTSYAAASVAGLVAYEMALNAKSGLGGPFGAIPYGYFTSSHSKVPSAFHPVFAQSVQQLVESQAWERVENSGVRILSNLKCGSPSNVKGYGFGLGGGCPVPSPINALTMSTVTGAPSTPTSTPPPSAASGTLGRVAQAAKVASIHTARAAAATQKPAHPAPAPAPKCPVSGISCSQCPTGPDTPCPPPGPKGVIFPCSCGGSCAHVVCLPEYLR